ncbi:hypothetical protein LX36DRAFT_379319 [Colletotrichum falcatum]|nr:hypothetical protein LX36DRAFT_379319 [Colletotrichum falcatum]
MPAGGIVRPRRYLVEPRVPYLPGAVFALALPLVRGRPQQVLDALILHAEARELQRRPFAVGAPGPDVRPAALDELFDDPAVVRRDPARPHEGRPAVVVPHVHVVPHGELPQDQLEQGQVVGAGGEVQGGPPEAVCRLHVGAGPGEDPGLSRGEPHPPKGGQVVDGAAAQRVGGVDVGAVADEVFEYPRVPAVGRRNQREPPRPAGGVDVDRRGGAPHEVSEDARPLPLVKGRAYDGVKQRFARRLRAGGVGVGPGVDEELQQLESGLAFLVMLLGPADQVQEAAEAGAASVRPGPPGDQVRRRGDVAAGHGHRQRRVPGFVGRVQRGAQVEQRLQRLDRGPVGDAVERRVRVLVDAVGLCAAVQEAPHHFVSRLGVVRVRGSQDVPGVFEPAVHLCPGLEEQARTLAVAAVDRHHQRGVAVPEVLRVVVELAVELRHRAVGEEEPDDVGEAPPRRHHQHGAAVAHLVDVRAVLEEEGHVLGQVVGGVQGGPPVGPLPVNDCAALQEQLGDLDLGVGEGRGEQGGIRPLGDVVDGRPLFEEELHQPGPVQPDGKGQGRLEGRVFVRVPRIQLGAFFDEERDRLLVPPPHGPVEEHFLVGVDLVGLRALVDEEAAALRDAREAAEDV